MRISSPVVVVLTVAVLSAGARADDRPLREQAASALRRAATFFRERVSAHGGYLWLYSADLSQREGEGKAGPETVWVQPPGTPSVGRALLGAYQATGDRYYLDAARAAGECLVRGQLRSGGWDYRIEFDPKRRRKYAYRVDPERPGARNSSTLDDNTTQAALRLLIQLDQMLAFRDRSIHEAVEYGLRSLLQVQYPNGAWPQRFDRPPDPAKYPVRKASYPASWSRVYPKPNYRGFYTFNDNVMADVIEVMFRAYWTYGRKEYLQAAEQAGGFILLAQMPDPQPAWAQQYDAAMHPAWARRFEPPSITGGESQGVLRTLLRLYRDTGDQKYLEPVPRAVRYLRRSQLKDGRLARFYELKTNRPLYFTRDYQLTYDDRDMPTHYAFKVSSRLDSIQQEYERLQKRPPKPLGKPPAASPPRSGKKLERRVRRIINALDDQGRWVQKGQLRFDQKTARVIDCRTFIENVGILSRYLATAR